MSSDLEDRARREHSVRVFYSPDDGGYIADIPDLRRVGIPGRSAWPRLVTITPLESVQRCLGNRTVTV
jgi:hypothetical protein